MKNQIQDQFYPWLIASCLGCMAFGLYIAYGGLPNANNDLHPNGDAVQVVIGLITLVLTGRQLYYHTVVRNWARQRPVSPTHRIDADADDSRRKDTSQVNRPVSHPSGRADSFTVYAEPVLTPLQAWVFSSGLWVLSTLTKSIWGRRLLWLALPALVVCWSLQRWVDYYVPNALDRGRDMTRLDERSITYLTPGDVRRLPTRGRGESWTFPKVKAVSPAVAKVLFQETANLTLSLDGVTGISDAAVAWLARRPGNLSLDGLTTLSDHQASLLAGHGDGYLSLKGLTTLSLEAAKSLARHRSLVFLDGLSEVSDETLAELRSSDRVCTPDSLRHRD